MDNEVQRQIAANESAFRDVNEGIARGQWPGEQDRPASFRCECARLGCNVLVDLSPREYERIRSNSRWLLVLPGHELAEAEKVVDSGDGYLIVEKTDEAGRAAEKADRGNE